jgi:hypothetical protein
MARLLVVVEGRGRYYSAFKDCIVLCHSDQPSVNYMLITLKLLANCTLNHEKVQRSATA